MLGKPWSVPFEFPLYQWTVVGVGDVTGLSLTHAGRAVSIACFYLALPAMWLLLGRLGLAATRRVVVLAAVLTCPLYIFFARAFLIETMALMFSLWFLQAFVAAIERRSWVWLIVANVAGVGAGLVKVTTFMVYLMPAGIWSVVWLGRARPQAGAAARGWSPLGRTAGWIAAATAAPFAATYAWIRFSDGVKLLNPSSRNLTSAATAAYNFGTWHTRLSADIWREHAEIILRGIIAGAVLAVAVALGLLFAGRWRRWIGWCLGLFAAAQALFPVLYAWHEYYYVANGVFLMAALGLVLCGLLDSAGPRAAAWILVLGLCAGQAAQYLARDHALQARDRGGANELTQALRAATPPDGVLVIAGEDWASMTPFYAQRRALMIRRDMEGDGAYLREAFDRLQGERVAALILDGAQRDNQALRDRAAQAFDLDPRPACTWKNATVYFARAVRAAAIEYLRRQKYLDLSVVAAGEPGGSPLERREVSLDELLPGQREVFAAMSPRPARFYTTFGLDLYVLEGRWFLSAHPDSRFWFRVAPGRHRVAAEFCLTPGSWEGLARRDATDGAEFAIYEQRSDGTKRPVFDRFLNPVDDPADRGIQRLRLTVDLAPGSELLFETGPGPRGNYNRDWAAWGPITIE